MYWFPLATLYVPFGYEFKRSIISYMNVVASYPNVLRVCVYVYFLYVKIRGSVYPFAEYVHFYLLIEFLCVVLHLSFLLWLVV